MDIDTRRRVVRAARTLLQWDQERFAKSLGVGTSTLKRYEAGYPADERTAAQMLERLAAVGIAIIERRSLDGLKITAGVALLEGAVIGDPPPLRGDAKPTIRKKGVLAPASSPDPVQTDRAPGGRRMRKGLEAS